jgi:anti-sigma factor RsiW
MDCDASRRLLGPYVDGELDLVHHLEVEDHLRTCPACARAAEDLRAGRSLLRGALPRHAAPAGLVQRIRASLPAGVAPPPSRPAATGFRRYVVMTGSLAAALAVGFFLGAGRQNRDRLVDEAVTDHFRSLEAGHLTDVVSTDQHTVKPWFDGKIDFAPPVTDFAAIGFPLVGGRLEEVDHRTAAAIVYRRRQHPINLFVWPGGSAPLPSRRSQHHGYAVESWSEADLNFIAVSEIPADELDQFVQAVRGLPR